MLSYFQNICQACQLFLGCMYCRWLAMGCIAHALNLFIKDYGNEKKASGTAAVVMRVRLVKCVRVCARVHARLHE